MRKFKRQVSFSDVNGIIGTVSLVKKISAAEKVILVKLNKKLMEEFKDEAETFEDRRDAALTIGKTMINWSEAEKLKKPVEFTHKEISTIAAIFLKALSSDNCDPVQAETLFNVAGPDCLLLQTFLEKNIDYDKIKLIEVPEDADLIPEEDPE